MAGRSGARGGGTPRPRRSAGARKTPAPAGRKATRTPVKPATPGAPVVSAAVSGPFRLGAVEGATPGKWIGTWRERLPHAPLELVPLQPDDQRAALIDGSVDAAIVRMPIDRSGLHVIALYDEVAVVVCAADSHLTAADELTFADLVDEIVIAPRQLPLDVDVPGARAPRFDPPETIADAIAIAATGVGVVIVPLSLARLHHRKDAAHRPLAGAPASPVALAWREGETTPQIDAFIGIVRGRTANSSR